MIQRRIFGFAVSQLSAREIAHQVATTPPPTRSQGRSCGRDWEGVGLVVTPNIDHVRRLSDNRAFAQAYAWAAIITCDGFPVYRYAQMRGCVPAGRVTGCDIARELLRHEPLGMHRLFFVADSQETAAGLVRWARRRGLSRQVATHVPPHGFERDSACCDALLGMIESHGTTLLLMGVGAPKSEIFVHQHRKVLPQCWALCVGQALRIEAGVIRRAPALVLALNAEWMWRLGKEPRRLASRYAVGSMAFVAAVARDVRRHGVETGSQRRD